MAVRADFDPPGEFSLRILDALGTAWSTFSLYPDPVSQPAFTRVVEMLAEELHPPLVVIVGPGTFLDGEEAIPTRRDGSERLARELFLHDVEAVRIRGGVSGEDLLAFFEVVELDDEHVRQQGGISAVTRELGEIGIEVFERGLLVLTELSGDDDGSDGSLDALMADAEGLSPAAAAANRGAEPDEVAALLGIEIEADATAEGEPVGDAKVASFLSGLAELHEHAAPYAETAQRVAGALREGATDPWKGFRTFLEAFFHLRRPAQLMVLESILTDTESTAHQLFLDQLSGADLADYVPELTAQGQEALNAYAVVVGSEAGRPGETVEGLTASSAVSSARQAVAARIGEVLASATTDRPAAEETLIGLRGVMSKSIDDYTLGTTVLRGLLECEDRDERFARVLRVWTGRVSRYLRDGEWQPGRDLLDAILRDPPYAAERDAEVREALERVAGRETLRLLLEEEQGAEPSEDAFHLVEVIGPAIIGPLVDLLVREEDAHGRKMLTSLLARAATPDPKAVEPHLAGQPWFVLRNLATVLAKTNKEEAAPALRQLASHEDHRVRAEALRGLVRIQRDGAAPMLVRSLSDANERVRSAAAALIRATESEDLDRLLVRELEADRLRTDVAVAVVGILAGRRTPQARRAVEELARKRFSVKGGSRAVRDAARQALQGRVG